MRIPGVASATDAFKNLWGSFKMGSDFVNRESISAGKAFNFKSIGGIATLGGLGGVGAMAGAGVGALAFDEDPVEGAAIGGAVGGVAGVAAMPAIGATTALAGKGIQAGAEKASFNIAAKGGYKEVAKAAYGAASQKAKVAGAGVSSLGRAAKYRYGGIVSGIVDNIGTFEPGNFEIGKKGSVVKGKSKLKLSKFGKGLAWGAFAVAGAREGIDELHKSRTGRMTGVSQNTPRLTQHNPYDDAGASGDLNFALHKNRHG